MELLFAYDKESLQRLFYVQIYYKCGQCFSLLEVAFATAYQLELVSTWYGVTVYFGRNKL